MVQCPATGDAGTASAMVSYGPDDWCLQYLRAKAAATQHMGPGGGAREGARRAGGGGERHCI